MVFIHADDYKRYVKLGKIWVKKIFSELHHHGIEGMHWGVRNGPPYPLERASLSIGVKQAPTKGRVRFKTGSLSSKAYSDAKRLSEMFPAIPLSHKERETLFHEINNNASDEQRAMPLFHFDCGDNEYVIINFGFDNYKPIDKIPLEDVNIHEIDKAIDRYRRR